MDTHRVWVHIRFIYKGRKGAWRPASVDNPIRQESIETLEGASWVGHRGDRGGMIERGRSEAPSAKAGL